MNSSGSSDTSSMRDMSFDAELQQHGKINYRNIQSLHAMSTEIIKNISRQNTKSKMQFKKEIPVSVEELEKQKHELRILILENRKYRENISKLQGNIGELDKTILKRQEDEKEMCENQKAWNEAYTKAKQTYEEAFNIGVEIQDYTDKKCFGIVIIKHNGGAYPVAINYDRETNKVTSFEANFLEPSVKKELLEKYVDKCSFSPLFVHLRNNILNKTNG